MLLVTRFILTFSLKYFRSWHISYKSRRFRLRQFPRHWHWRSSIGIFPAKLKLAKLPTKNSYARLCCESSNVLRKINGLFSNTMQTNGFFITSKCFNNSKLNTTASSTQHPQLIRWGSTQPPPPGTLENGTYTLPGNASTKVWKASPSSKSLTLIYIRLDD